MSNMKNIFIMGDSYSTYKGYIPEEYAAYYSDEREAEPIVAPVSNTWWKKLVFEMNLNLVCNDSYSGSTVCNTTRPELPLSSSFVNRMDSYINKDFFSENNIDTVFIFGGTNDSWIDSPVGELMYEKWSEDALKCVLPAFCYILDRIKKTNEAVRVVVILNTDLKPEITENFVIACEKFGTEYIRLCEIDKKNGHPTVLGMEQIKNQVKDFLTKK